MSSSRNRIIQQFYDALYREYGPQGWWPGDSPTEIIIGAILTQNTNWKNVEKAIVRLREERAINWRVLHEMPARRLAGLIRPAGYFNVKAKRLKNFARWISNGHMGDVDRLRAFPLSVLRDSLLAINGIGPETADSILLYALDMPSFVIDAYTRRVAIRHHLAREDEADYDSLKEIFEGAMPRKTALYNEYHALMVAVAKRHCRVKAHCAGCPLERFPHEVGAT